MTWSCKFVQFRKGLFVKVPQWPEAYPELSWNAKSAAGTSHDKIRFVLASVRLKAGEGLFRNIQIVPGAYVGAPPPPTAPINSLPSAEHATLVQLRLGTLFEVQLSPEFVEV